MRTNYLRFLYLISFLLMGQVSWGQADPTTIHDLPFSMPNANQIGNPGAFVVCRGWGSIPTSLQTNNGTKNMTTWQAGGTGNTGGFSVNGVDGIGMLASSNATNGQVGAIIFAINTTGKSDIRVTWTAKTLLQQASRDNSVALQYRVGSGTTWTTISGSTYTSAGQAQGSSQTFTDIALPAAVDDNEVVYIRWMYWESSGSAGSRDRIAIGNILVTSNITLPIDLTSFNATPQDDRVVLDWTYENAVDFDKFVVEHSADGKVWAEVATIPLLESASRSAGQNIQTIHYDPVRGVNYYRLKLVDIDGTYKYSKIVAANLSGSVTSDIHPVNTVVTQQIQLLNTGVKGDVTVRFTDMQGRVISQEIYRSVEDSGDFFINAEQVPSGMFIMTIATVQGEQSFKMIKY